MASIDKLAGAIGGVGGATEKVIKPIVTLVLLVAAYLVIRKIVKSIKQRKVGTADYDKGDLNPNINYDNIAAKVHDDFTGLWQSDWENVSSLLMSLGDNELKYVYTRYDKLFGKGANTMYGEMTDYPSLGFIPGDYEAILKRMERLGLV